MILGFIILLIILLNALLLFIQKMVSSTDSDHPYHLGLINGIRDNRHRFVKYYPNIIGEKNFAYPQLFHWILSFLSKSFLDKYYSIIGIILNYLSLFLILIIIAWTHNISDSNIPLESFILYAGLLYVLTPFSWAIWNAKNSGISARGLGLFLGYLYQFLILLYFHSGNWIILLFIFLIIFIILLSSQFANQFVLLTLPFYAILYNNYFLLVFPLVAFLLFYLMNKDIALSFVKGQYWHKTIYYKYLAKVYIIKMRPSIWRDLVFDIWKQIIQKPLVGILYAYHNPVITIFIAIPTLSYLIFFFLGQNDHNLTKIESVIYYNIIIVLIVFLLISFKKTRFLGEPERYVEFAIPNIILLTLFTNSDSNFTFNIILFVSCLLIAFQFLFLLLIKKRETGKSQNILGEKVANAIREINLQQQNLRIFSNNHQLLKHTLSTDAKVLLTNLTSFYTGSYSFTDIFPEKYGKISNSVIVEMMREFDINCFILDTSMYKCSTITNFKESNFKEYFVSKDFVIYIRKA